MSLFIRVSVITLSLIASLGVGLMIGREVPVHHYERFGNTAYLLDTSTGTVCGLVPGAPLTELGSVPATTPSGQPSVFGDLIAKQNQIPPCSQQK